MVLVHITDKDRGGDVGVYAGGGCGNGGGQWWRYSAVCM